MQNIFLKVIFLGLMAICTCSYSNTSTDKPDSLIVAYSNKLSKLDITKLESISLATKLFKKSFSNQSAIICDSAYFVFNRFAEITISKLNEEHEKDTTDFWPLFLIEENNKPPIVPKKLIDFNRKLEENGLFLNSDDASTYISIDGDYIERQFFSYLSKNLVVFLRQQDFENKNPYEIDAGLIISPQKFCDRIMWWENFIIGNPNFEYINYAIDIKRRYVSILFSGSDNTPLINDNSIENKLILGNYYKDALDYLKLKYPKSSIINQLSSYYNAILKKDKKLSKEIIKELTKQKIIEDYIEIDEF